MIKTVYINGRFLSQQITGVQRYAIELVKALDALLEAGDLSAAGMEFVLVTTQDIKTELRLSRIKTVKIGKRSGHAWEQLELPRFAKNGLLINLCNSAPLFKKQQILTIHDAAVFLPSNTYSKAYVLWYKLMYKRLRRTLRKVITVSEFSKRELMKYCGFRENSIAVIYEGKEHILGVGKNDAVLEKFKLKKGNYVLAVSSMSPNKNFKTIANAIELMGDIDFEIVIAGGANPKVFKDADFEFSPKVKYIGYISDEELKTLFENAGCFIYPSFYEGFGLPPLEAMACGCPVIVSNAASIPEVCGDAVVYCDPYSVKDVAEKVVMLMNDENLKQSLKEKGRVRAESFSWYTTALESFHVCQEVLKHENRSYS
ncbi:glycosyltransferase family 4 protein [Paenibacillus methanolicus]|uniref:Glycosyltransferase involved in cell wall biosynthesis n=1 Tax=Paenibacillus methanolicus TaxID=582686 RepID=A0A5S5BTJ6_9BACL|nr:glycosyltransferase family 1 protein [Paenibacillus methanolicus]TYP70274.1 glycosyltransferase involved in cell wall biosynthesis [Paenibacillus methanolicus]